MAEDNLKEFTIKASYFSPSVKYAQSHGDGSPAAQFWMYGLIEGMLEGVRGSDWLVYDALQPYVADFWNAVEKERMTRKESGKDEGVPFDTLLAIKSHQTSDPEIDHTQTLQALLSSNRVW